MEDIIKKFIEEKMREEMIKDAEYVGELPTHILDKLRVVKLESERFDEDLELRKRQYQIEMKRKIEEEFDPRYEEYKKNHMAIWNEIYRVMNIDPNGHYYNEGGRLYAERPSSETDSKWSKSGMDFTRPFRM